MQDEGNWLRALWRFLRPESDELIVYIIISFIFVGFASYRLASTGALGTEPQDLIRSGHSIFEQTTEFMNSGTGWARFFLFGFWFIVGTVAYFLIWFVSNLFIDIRNNIAISVAFIHPRSFHQSDYWLSVTLRWMLRATAGVAFLFYIAYWFAIFAPVTLHAVQAAILSTSIFGVAINILSFLVINWLSLHIATLLLRTMLLRYSFS